MPLSVASSVLRYPRSHHGQLSPHTTSASSSRLLTTSTPMRPRSTPTPCVMRRAVSGGTGSLERSAASEMIKVSVGTKVKEEEEEGERDGTHGTGRRSRRAKSDSHLVMPSRELQGATSQLDALTSRAGRVRVARDAPCCTSQTATSRPSMFLSMRAWSGLIENGLVECVGTTSWIVEALATGHEVDRVRSYRLLSENSAGRARRRQSSRTSSRGLKRKETHLGAPSGP